MIRQRKQDELRFMQQDMEDISKSWSNSHAPAVGAASAEG
jgi:hypothetical protein